MNHSLPSPEQATPPLLQRSCSWAPMPAPTTAKRCTSQPSTSTSPSFRLLADAGADVNVSEGFPPCPCRQQKQLRHGSNAHRSRRNHGGSIDDPSLLLQVRAPARPLDDTSPLLRQTTTRAAAMIKASYQQQSMGLSTLSTSYSRQEHPDPTTLKTP